MASSSGQWGGGRGWGSDLAADMELQASKDLAATRHLLDFSYVILCLAGSQAHLDLRETKYWLVEKAKY